MPRLTGRTGKLAGGMPLADRLAVTLALKGTLTMQQAMHSTGIVAPAPSDGSCGHQQGTARDGRCLGCKREADQRTYRKRQYVAALAELVTRGVAETGTSPKGTQVWKYAGPSYGYVAPRPLPALPYECDPDTAEHFRANVGRMPERGDGEPRQIYVTLQLAVDQARLGAPYPSHGDCAVCLAVYETSRVAHRDLSIPAVEARAGRREEGHEACRFCLAIDEAADAQRRQERLEAARQRDAEAAENARAELTATRLRRRAEAQRDGRRYAYEDGRRILRDGRLCDCPACDERQEQRRAEQVAAQPTVAPGGVNTGPGPYPPVMQMNSVDFELYRERLFTRTSTPPPTWQTFTTSNSATLPWVIRPAEGTIDDGNDTSPA